MNIIYISNDIEKTKEELKKEYSNLYIFEDNDLKLNLVREIKEEAYKTTDIEKYILIKAINFRIESQNALLKILEETPQRINFIILTTSKYALLDTIRSRLPIKYLNYDIKKRNLNLDLSNLTLLDIYNFLKENSFEKEELKNFIYQILNHINKYTEDILEDLELAIKLVDLNSDTETIIAFLLMSIRRVNADI